jgi:hypothetical protein
MARLFAALVMSAVSARAEETSFAPRRAADERLFLSPTPDTLPPGHFVVSNDEVLLFRLGVGLTHRLQLDLWLGGFPLAGAGVIPVHGVLAGGAGAGLVGVFDIGLKVRLLDEDATAPGIAFSYDLLDAFGAGVGVAGAVLDGTAPAGAGGAVVGGVSAQFNVFSLTVGKHFGSTHVVAFLPQSAGFAAGGATTGTGASTSGGTPIGRFPTTFSGFLAAEQVLGDHSALAVELAPGRTLADSSAVTGARWLVGFDEPVLFLPLNRLRLRLDLAFVWSVSAPTDVSPRSQVTFFPWLGIGFYTI